MQGHQVVRVHDLSAQFRGQIAAGPADQFGYLAGVEGALFKLDYA